MDTPLHLGMGDRTYVWGGGRVLVENTLFGVRDKVKDALEMLREFEPEEGYYLAYSGGKTVRYFSTSQGVAA